jgi:hypothetical protein
MRTSWFAWILVAAFAIPACNPGIADDDAWDDDDDDDSGGTPDLAVSTDPIDMGQVSIATGGSASLTMANEGDGDLEVHYVTVSDSAGHVIEVEPWHGHIEPGGSVTRTVTAACVDPGELLGVVEIGSNDPDEPTYGVNVSLTCVP